ncbi:MAG: hypothetical protein ACREDT_07390 [Methylocella sp.]
MSVRAGSRDRNEVRNLLEQLDQSANPVIGAVLNQCNPKTSGRRSQPITDIAAICENERVNGTSDEMET